MVHPERGWLSRPLIHLFYCFRNAWIWEEFQFFELRRKWRIFLTCETFHEKNVYEPFPPSLMRNLAWSTVIEVLQYGMPKMRMETVLGRIQHRPSKLLGNWSSKSLLLKSDHEVYHHLLTICNPNRRRKSWTSLLRNDLFERTCMVSL